MDLKNVYNGVATWFTRQGQACWFCGGRCEHGVCDGCHQDLPRSVPLAVPRLSGVTVVDVPFSYCYPMDRLIQAFKFHKDPLARVAATYLFSNNVSAHLPTNALGVAVPISLSRYLQRGFNQSLVLAQGLAKARQLALDEHLVRRVRGGLPQSQLASGLRRRNLDNAFRAVPRRAQAYQQVPVVIIDDVITTGTTVVQVAAALKRCGVGEISVCALAATMPRQVN